MKKIILIFITIFNFLSPSIIFGDEYYFKNNGNDITMDYNSPYKRSIVKIYSKIKNENSYSFGTGTFINKNFILTAAHNIIRDTGDLNLNNIEDLGFISETDDNINIIEENNNLTIENDKKYSLKETSLKNKKIYFFNLDEYNQSIKIKDLHSRKFDLALIETEQNPLNLNDFEIPNFEENKKSKKNDFIYYLGYPGVENLTNYKNENISIKKIHKIETNITSIQEKENIILYNSSSIGGMSGASIFNKENKLIGIHLFFAELKNQNITLSGGLNFNQEQINWIKNKINESQINQNNKIPINNSINDKNDSVQKNLKYTIPIISFILGFILLIKSIKHK